MPFIEIRYINNDRDVLMARRNFTEIICNGSYFKLLCARIFHFIGANIERERINEIIELNKLFTNRRENNE